MGEWTATPSRNLIEREGKSLKINRLTMEVLVYLAHHAGEVVSMDELIGAVWKGRVVGDGTVYQNINQLRYALGDSAEEGRFIETIPKRGYRLVAPVTTVEPGSGKESSQGGAGRGRKQGRSWKHGYAIAGVLAFVLLTVVVRDALEESSYSVTDDRRSIAVLPFLDESAAGDNVEFFAAGLHGDLLTQLAKINSLKVISRSSVMDYRDTEKNLREIGQELGATSILEGVVQRAGDTLRINVQLIDAETNEHLWAEIYDRELTVQNIFSIQREMATSIAEALQATLLPEEIARLNEVPTESTRAYDFYLTAEEYLRRPNDQVFAPFAVEMYERAIREDPQFDLALAGLARAHLELCCDSSHDPHLRMAEEAVHRALALAPDSPEAHLAMAHYHYIGYQDWDNTLRELARAERGMPGESQLHYLRALTYRRLGQWELSQVTLDRAIGLAPRYTPQLDNQALTYIYLHDYDEGERILDRALEIAPDYARAYMDRAGIPLWRDGDSAAIKAAAAGPPMDLGGERHWLGWTAALYERDYDTAIDYLDDWELDALRQQRRYVPKTSLYGVTHQLAGHPEQAEPYFRTARMQLDEALAAAPRDARLYNSLGEVMVGLGESESAVGMALQALELLAASQDAFAGPGVRLDAIVRVLVPAGDYETALVQLDELLAIPERWSIEGLLPDPRLDPIRNDPRFLELVEKYRR